MTENMQTKTMLPKAKQKLHWRGQVQYLRTVAARATAKADWFEELIEQKQDALRLAACGDAFWLERKDELEDEILDLQADIVPYRNKARMAAEEMLAIAKANGDERVRSIR